ncbi:MAG TPA: efflux RND transporter permease subunit [Thermoanaerobaculia bacterium]|nr:efflux RND transporter permease subunit [Thermoanaerobaculia bacterium]
MEALAQLAARRPVAVTVLALAVALVGWIAWTELPLDLLPDVRSPTIVVMVTSGDRPPTEMERLYGEQVERRLFAVRGIREVSQVARTGRLIASVRFDWDANMDLALVDVQKAINPVAADPEVDDVLVRHLDPRQAPVMSLGLVAEEGGPDLAELRRVARRQVSPAMEQLPGVAEVRVLGGRELEVRVEVDLYRMEAFGVSLDLLESRLRAENVDIDAGTLEEGGQVYLVRGLSRFRRPEDVARVVVKYGSGTGGRAGRPGAGVPGGGGGEGGVVGSAGASGARGSVIGQPRRPAGVGRQPIRVSDLAEVTLADGEIDHLVRVDAVEGVGLQVFKEAGANTVAVSRTVREALAGLTRDLPRVEVVLVADEAALVEDALADLRNAAGFGILLAVLVLVLFLRSLGPTVVVASAVPVSIFAALFLMRLFDYSLNVITLAGLALGAGMLVDNAIVVVESIHRRLTAGDPTLTAAARGTGEVAGAIVASTLTTCVVFLPVIFVQGLAARLIEGIAFTVVTSLMASLLVALMLIPALSRWLLPRRRRAGEGPHRTAAAPAATGVGEGLDRAERTGVPSVPVGPDAEEPRPLGRAFDAVERLVLVLLRVRWVVVGVAVLLAGVAVWVLLGLGTELLPPADPRQFSLRMIGPAGQRVEATSSAVATVEQAIREAAGDDVEAILSEVGRLPDDDRFITTELTEENTARIVVRLAAEGATGGMVVASLAPALADLPETEIEWEVGASALSRALGTSGPPIAVEIAGQSLEDLRIAATRIRDALAEREELWNVRSSFEGGPPELRVELDRAMADGLGIDLETVARVLETSLDGRAVTLLTTGDEEREVVLHLPRPRREELAELRFTAPDGAPRVLGQVARFEPAEGAREIFRRDQRRVALVTGRIAERSDYPSAVAGASEALATVDLPPGLATRLAGEEEERERTVGELRWAGIMALVLVLMVLAGTFESLLQPITVLFAIPLALIGVATALAPVGRPVGVMALLGLIVLAGVAVNDAVLLLATARRLIAEGMERSAGLARAAAIRLRPILMTTLTTILALAPLAVGGGEAAALRSPMALTIIGGMVTSTAGSLLVLPCLYAILDRGRGSGARGR